MVQKICTLLLVACLLFIMSAYSFGAVHPLSSPFTLGDSWYSKTDTWYSIKQDQPNVNVYARNITPDFSVVGGEYYQNDQTFADLFYQNINGSDMTYFGGSFLSESGFFIGLNYLEIASITATQLSPGYRFKVNDKGYVALSFDYLSDDYTNTDEIVSYGVNFKLFPENMKICGEISLPTEGNNTVVHFNANYQVNNRLVAGAGFMSQGNDNAYSAGFTYAVQSLIIDGKLGKTFVDHYHQFAGMYNLKKFGIGALYQKYQNDSDPGVTIQGKYQHPKGDFILKYTFENDSYNQVTVLAYERKL